MFKRGFTILELVAVLVIIGILAGLGAVTYSQLITDSQAEVNEKTALAAAREAQASVALANAGVVTAAAIADEVDGGTGATDADFTLNGATWTVTITNGVVSVA
ncbi:MAG: prepilin-type N-terminal cleavage/methylation domain-containing protein [Actinomycetia bacterium]|nr:prepilin-type N-terminal cleavage/methylation domain-containing protein [Actinomycetes bacterium]MCP4845038.1 prepilin-type N-terminal cleavage/methylation domain-containing protein [Actinomycetes bacterium]